VNNINKMKVSGAGEERTEYEEELSKGLHGVYLIIFPL
jgi:hypothetical protein